MAHAERTEMPAEPSAHNTRPRRGRFLRMPDVVAEIGLSSATINRLHRRHEFPAKVSLSERCVGWWEQDIAAWKAERPDARQK